ncbi:MAG: DUF3754 domain-containing protein [Planctomycetes bacterium]|nr:DUF3754 domain-containing protein [Planctomycetota bacterium]
MTYQQLAEKVSRLFPDPGEAEWARQVACLMRNLAGHEFDASLARLKEIYAPFDPDATEASPGPPEGGDPSRAREAVVAATEAFLNSAGFRPLPPADLEAALRIGTSLGLRIRVDLERFEVLRLYGLDLEPGAEVSPRKRRVADAVNLKLGVYRRVAVVAIERGSDRIHVKLFKEVESADIETLIPGVRISMTIRDQVVLIASGGTGVGTIWKFGFTFLPGPFRGLVAAVLGVALAVGGRTWFNFRRRRDAFCARLAQYLYYHVVASDGAALAALSELAEEEAEKQALLAYGLARTGAGRTGTEGLVRAAGEMLGAARIPLDAGLALLRRWRIISTERGGAIRAGSPARVARRLDGIWDGLWSAGRHGGRAASEGERAEGR